MVHQVGFEPTAAAISARYSSAELLVHSFILSKVWRVRVGVYQNNNLISSTQYGQRGQIRTDDLLDPNQVEYLTILHADVWLYMLVLLLL